ncbi:glycosyltransferase [Rhodococcus sp. OK302]|uniref:glycosyltransferase n=1 Tax=Rhodococcus sp. OK302 TaxID=1882769 RepID=UPI000B9F59DE|nr:glycosyltransferase [Rhodococcus sp. OK302]OYD61284.1 MGT family glycosyltransferase [Rhodococcus sp. OK302]
MPSDLDHEFEVIGNYFAGTLAHRHAERAREIIDLWQPDLLVCDDMDFGAMIAAEQAGIPRIVVNVIASGALTRIEHVHRPLAQLRQMYGLPSDPNLVQLTRDLIISPGPSSFRHPNFPLSSGAISVRSETEPARADIDHPAVAWLAGGNEAHRVYVTLGTIFNTESGDLFIRVLQGLRDLPVRVLATVGPAIDPASIPVTADNIRIERFVQQAAVLEHCDLVINHGGSGSVLGAIANGVPLITLPMGADQELNAERLTQLGAGITLDPITVTSADIRETTRTALASKNLCAGAQRLQRENHDLPPVSAVLGSILATRELTTHTESGAEHPAPRVG